MKPSFRRDKGQYQKPELTSQGYLRADAYATRAGIFSYLLPDGSVHRELRPPEEVFRPDSLETLSQIGVTNNHPPEPLNASNTKTFAVGFTGEAVERNDSFVQCRLTVTDSNTIRQMTDNQKRELSCGYLCDVDETPGVWQGQPFDAIQRNIRYNHLAIVDQGRAGPEVRIRMDSNEARMVTDDDIVPAQNNTDEKNKTKKVLRDKDGSLSLTHETKNQRPEGGSFMNMNMAKIKIDNVEYETSEVVAKVLADKQNKIEELSKRLETLQGRCDALEVDLNKKDSEIETIKESKPDPKALMAMARSRLDLEDFAKKVLGAETKFDEKSDSLLKKEIVQKISPEVKLDNKSEEYINGSFDFIREHHQHTDADPNVGLKKNLESKIKNERVVMDSTQAREKMMQESKHAWKKGLPEYGSPGSGSPGTGNA